MTAYYLKYRPQSLEELIGQEPVKKILLSAFQENRLSHAYLFVGPRGTGKTSTARILAKMVNCEIVNRKSLIVNRENKNDNRYPITDIPCNKCSTCLSITDGSNLDLIEIDAASNRGIEDIRALREKIKLAPTNAKKKVYIIDEVHMLTTEAFNALLKTLEEPPAHALFVLATTDVNKVPQTILSRVQRLDFKFARASELMEALIKIAREEKIDIDEEALKLLIRKSEGSFRDGVKLLDQVSSIEGKITKETLEKSLKSSNFDDISDLIKYFSKKDTKEGLSIVLEMVENGADIKETVLSLMDVLRNLVFIKNELGEQLVKPQMVEEKYVELMALSETFSNHDLVRILEILQKVNEKFRFASIPSLPLELAVVEICGEQSTVNSSLREASLQSTINSEKSQDKIKSDKLEDEKLVSGESLLSAVEGPHPTSNSDIVILKEKWTFVLETVRPLNFSLEALLRSINLTECTDTTVILEVPYSFHQRILEAPKNRDLLESILSDILGRSIRVSTVLGNRPTRKEDIANVEVAQDDEIIRVAAEIFNSDSIN